jgi:7-carboxy-7-deazaguanine synthase
MKKEVEVNDKFFYEDLFVSIQGESTDAGRLCIFLRLWGCSVGCTYCIGVKDGRHIPRVIMSQEPNKKITDVKIGDKLMTLDDEGNHVETTVVDTLSRVAPNHYGIKIEGKKEIFATPEHPFMTQRGWVRADELTLDDEVIHITPHEKISFNKNIGYYHNGLKVERIKFYDQEIDTFNFTCEPYNTYLLDYMLVHNCDQKQIARNKKIGSVRTLVRDILNISNVPYVCITGGEPLEQKELLYLLVYELIYNGKEVSIETSGCVPIEEEPYQRSYKYVMDIKCPSSGVEDQNIFDNIFKLQKNDEVKFVIKDRTDYEYALEVLRIYPIPCQVLFSPVFNKNDHPVIGSELVQWLLDDNLINARVSVQVHKILGVL